MQYVNALHKNHHAASWLYNQQPLHNHIFIFLLTQLQ